MPRLKLAEGRFASAKWLLTALYMAPTTVWYYSFSPELYATSENRLYNLLVSYDARSIPENCPSSVLSGGISGTDIAPLPADGSTRERSLSLGGLASEFLLLKG